MSTTTNGLPAKISETVNEAVKTAKEATTHTVPLLIKNASHHTSETFPVHSPSDGTHLHHCSSASIADTETAINTAHSAFSSWKLVSPSQKRDIFLRAASIFQSRAEELTSYILSETGASAGWAGFNIHLAREILLDVAGRISSIQGSIPTVEEPGVSAMVWREPYGVILAIAPWNAPYILGVRSIAYAIAAGNTAILKAPEFSPRCSWAICDIFHQAGLPEGVLNLLAHKTEDAAKVTKYLIEHKYVKKVNFTGSTVVGKIIARLAGENLKPVLLELGGKAPAIIWEDADLELAAGQCAFGAFKHAGQICMSTEKILVHKNVMKGFEEKFVKAVREFEGGGKKVLINKVGVKKNRGLIKNAVDKGAIVLLGPSAEEEEQNMEHTVLSKVTKDMDIYYTESFGPTVSLIEIKSEEEALEIANDTEYGLSSAVFTKDLGRGLRFARGIESGAVHINGATVHDETALPHGGMKASGYGRFGAIGLDEWLRTKTVTYRD